MTIARTIESSVLMLGGLAYLALSLARWLRREGGDREHRAS